MKINKILMVLFSFLISFLISFGVISAPKDAGMLRIKADKVGATIYVNDKKKATVGNSKGWTDIFFG